MARVIKPQGRHGEVAVELLTDFPEKFAERRRLTALLPDGTRRDVDLVDFWEHKGRLVMKFAGVESIDDAEKLARAELQIASSDRAELEAGAAYIGDLVGCRVIVTQGDRSAADIGAIEGVMFGSGSAPLLIVAQKLGDKNRELMIPFAEQYIRRLDVQNKLIELALPEGMLELDAPLSSEEKEDQHRKH